MKKADYQALEAIAVYGLTNSAAIEVIRVNEDEERIYYALTTSEGRQPVRFSRFYLNNSGETYFIAGKLGRVYLNECITTNYGRYSTMEYKG